MSHMLKTSAFFIGFIFAISSHVMFSDLADKIADLTSLISNFEYLRLSSTFFLNLIRFSV